MGNFCPNRFPKSKGIYKDENVIYTKESLPYLTLPYLRKILGGKRFASFVKPLLI
jgi:hypothetical protein